jgi:hypothetical protein
MMEQGWASWTMRKSGDDSRRASGTNFHRSKWHLIDEAKNAELDQGVIVTECGQVCEPHSNVLAFPVTVAMLREEIPKMDEYYQSAICKRCERISKKEPE